MGLSQALSAAAAGLRVTQAGLSLVAANVANAETPGYVLGGCRLARAPRRHRPHAQPVPAATVAHRGLGRRLRRPARAVLRTAAADPPPPRPGDLACDALH